MTHEKIIRRLEAVEAAVAALEERLTTVEKQVADHREVDMTVLSAISSAHAAIRNAVRLTQQEPLQRNDAQ